MPPIIRDGVYLEIQQEEVPQTEQPPKSSSEADDFEGDEDAQESLTNNLLLDDAKIVREDSEMNITEGTIP